MAAETAKNQDFFCGVVEGFYGRPWTTEQRKELFVKMKKFGLNSYMYAPKDDLKHRAYWRELYTVEEAEHLTNLVQSAKDQGINFFYALSPGLDITYSNSKEVNCLKRKLEQVSLFGCNAFALLFDDIEPDISEADKEVFQSFGHAQVALTNEVYQHLSQPKFIFCPTEYCTTRAVPNVQNSEYLNIIGNKLLPGIDIMWTGSKVITKNLTIESVQELSEVLRRPPVIWDNLHANDYDQKRLFLGPYCGRSTELVRHLHGVMSNPNCEYETNFIPIHTLGQWSQCNSDGKRDLMLNDSITADIKLETESDNGWVEDIPSQLGPNIYHPKRALQAAILEWLPEFDRSKNAYGKIISSPFLPIVSPIPPQPSTCPTALVNTCMSVTLTTTSPLQNLNLTTNMEDANYHPLSTELVNSLVTTPALTPMVPSSTSSKASSPLITLPYGVKEPILEPMDCNPSPNPSPKHSSSNSPSVTQVGEIADEGMSEGKLKDSDSAEEMQTEPSDSETADPKQLLAEDVSLLVDLFYLPFEYGSQGLQFLQDFHWLKSNGHLVANDLPNSKKGASSSQSSPEVEEWYHRASKFEEMNKAVNQLFSRLTYCQNRSLLYDLYPYVWDIKGVISLLNSYVKWLALGRVPGSASSYLCPPFTWFSKGYKEAFMSGDQEPWLFRGGLTAELQRLLPLESVGDLFLYKPPETLSSQIYTIRPYLSSDEAAVYRLCRQTCNDGEDGSNVFPDYLNLVGDKLVGGYLHLSPEYCFVVEDGEGLCGYALAAIEAKKFKEKLEVAWYPELCSKYPLPKKDPNSMFTQAEEFICSLHEPNNATPDLVYSHHPSILKLDMVSAVVDTSVSKRLMACILSALKANGSHGVFCEVSMREKNVVELYSKLGFLEISIPGFSNAENFYLGRTF